jgi:aromatic ring-cleaving dioxygenase
MVTSEIGKITGFHAHIYYDEDTRGSATVIRKALDLRFRGVIRLGRWHDKLVGPHTRSMYQVAFGRVIFPEIVPWLALNRNGLAILVHPESGDGLADHTQHALWMGEILEINRNVFSK